MSKYLSNAGNDWRRGVIAAIDVSSSVEEGSAQGVSSEVALSMLLVSELPLSPYLGAQSANHTVDISYHHDRHNYKLNRASFSLQESNFFDSTLG